MSGGEGYQLLPISLIRPTDQTREKELCPEEIRR
jgi:hypothetical protein